MEQSIQVAICGQSVAWSAVKAALHKLSNINVIHYTEPELWAELLEASVDVILFDSNTTTNLWADSSTSGPALLKFNFNSVKLIEPLNNKDNNSVVDDLILAIRGEHPDS